jgi:uncharacterized protein YlxP (DUF503 family)
MMAVLSLRLSLPGCASLKEKRGRLQPFLHRLQREFNLSVAEMDRQDQWGQAQIACGMVGNDRAHLERSMQTVRAWVQKHWAQGELLDDHLEII